MHFILLQEADQCLYSSSGENKYLVCYVDCYIKKTKVLFCVDVISVWNQNFKKKSVKFRVLGLCNLKQIKLTCYNADNFCGTLFKPDSCKSLQNSSQKCKKNFKICVKGNYSKTGFVLNLQFNTLLVVLIIF